MGSLSNRISLRNIQFPSIIDAITLDPDEHVFYAGGRDGKIHIAALNADSSSSKSHWLHIISSLPSHRFVIFLTDIHVINVAIFYLVNFLRLKFSLLISFPPSNSASCFWIVLLIEI